MYNTTPFKNISDKEFVGKYDNEDYPIKAGETRYFPTFVSEHFAKLLSEIMMDKKDKEGSDRVAMFAEMKARILGKEIMTAYPEKPLTFKEEVLEHERKFVEKLKKEKQEAEIKKLEAIKITRE